MLEHLHLLEYVVVCVSVTTAYARGVLQIFILGLLPTLVAEHEFENKAHAARVDDASDLYHLQARKGQVLSCEVIQNPVFLSSPRSDVTKHKSNISRTTEWK